MSSELQIVNRALGLSKETVLSSMDEARQAGDVARQEFGPTRDALLRQFIWQFALRRAALPALTGVTAPGFPVVVNLPSDFLALRALSYNPALLRENVQGTIDVTYRIEGNRILCDAGPLYIVYTARIEDAEQFDPMFEEVLVWRLTQKFRLALTDDLTKSDAARQEADKEIKKARAAGALEQAPHLLEAPQVSSGYGRLTPYPMAFPPGYR